MLQEYQYDNIKAMDIKEIIKEKIDTLVPLDNEVFCFMAKDKRFCEEFLRVVLEDEKLEVVDNDPQKFLPNVYFKSSIVDMLCKLGDGRIVNVEIQLYEEKEHAKRIFYYATMIRQMSVEKGLEYKEIKDIIVIYLTKEDIFKKLGSDIWDFLNNAGELAGRINPLTSAYNLLAEKIHNSEIGKWWDEKATQIRTSGEENILKFIDDCKVKLTEIKDWIKTTFTVDWESAWNDIKDAFSTAWDGIKETAKNGVNDVIRKVNKMIIVVI